MDLTALELGLRNRQLLQVKCFLKIQVETFRYFLTEELPRLKTAEERVSSLDKFFTHDWQNVINKIVSVACHSMTGDYVSMMLAVSLFRSVIQSCNQLLLIMSSVKQSELDALLLQVPDDPGKFVLSRSSSSTSSYDSHLQSDSSSIKEKIFCILQKQIRSIKSHLERIYNVNIGTDAESSSNIDYPIQPNISSILPKQNSTVALSLSNIGEFPNDVNSNTIANVIPEKPYQNLETIFQPSIEKTVHSLSDKIVLLQCLFKKHSLETASGNMYEWEHVVESIIEHVSCQLKSAELSNDLIDRVCCLLSQTGQSALYLLFSMFSQTSDAKLRQKLLQVLLVRYRDVATLEAAIQSELDSQNNRQQITDRFITQEKLDFFKYLQILSIIDLYAFCYRTKLNELQNIELSIESILQRENVHFSLVKSLVTSSLGEIAIHPELFANWRSLNQQIYSEFWHLLSEHFIQQQDFAKMISAEVLWQYWVDRNKVQSIVSWIEKGHATLPYCPSIVVPDELSTCQRMLQYVRVHGSFQLKQSVMQCLCLQQAYFGGFSLYQLDMEFTFQWMLGHLGQGNFLFGPAASSARLDLFSCFLEGTDQHRVSSMNLNFSMLIDYCLENELYEFLYLIFNRFRPHLERTVHNLMSGPTTENSEKKVYILQLLCHFNENESEIGKVKEDFIFSTALLTMKYLYGSSNFSSEDDSVGCIVKHLIEHRQDVDLAFLMLSFSDRVTFDHLTQRLSEISQKEPNLLLNFYNLLNSKYSLFWRVFEPALCIKQTSQLSFKPPPLDCLSKPGDTVRRDSYHSNELKRGLTSGSTVDLYSLLQQAIPYVNIDQFFKWQIKRREPRNRPSSGTLDESTDSVNIPGRVRKFSSSLNCENNELPNFSQNRLSDLYGLKAELTSSYYLKNGRLLKSFFKCFNLKSSSKSGRSREQSINPKLATKAIRKAALIAYSSIRQNSVFACSLLFQSLVRANTSSSAKTEATNRKAGKMEESMANTPTVGSDTNGEFEKTRLHLALGKLIIEFAADCLTVQSAQLQQSTLASLLRKSHFNGDRVSSQTLLDLGITALDRKWTQTQTHAGTAHRSILNQRLHSLLLSGEVNISADQKGTEKGLNSDDSRTALNALSEDCSLLMECFDWKPLLAFSDLHSLKKPLTFLSKCARQDNWLVFSIFAQMYSIAKDDIQVLLREGVFNNVCIGEHLAKAFQSSSRLSGVATLSAADTKLLKLKQAPNSSRNELYSRLFRGKVASNANEYDSTRQFSNRASDRSLLVDPPESDLISSSASSPETFSLGSLSMLSKLSDDGQPLVLYEQALKPEMANKDFLQLVLEIYQNVLYYGVRTNSSSYSFESTLRNTLLYSAVSLSNPVLALLACSLERPPLTPVISIKSTADSPYSRSHSVELSKSANSQFLFSSFMCWLLGSVKLNSKKRFIDSYLYSNSQGKKADRVQCYLDWSPDRSLRLIEVLTQEDACVFVTLTEGLVIFDLDIPILTKLLQFLIQFFIEKDYYPEENLLVKFKTLLQAYNEDEFMLSKGVPPTEYETLETVDDDFVSNQTSLRIFYSKNWIEKCCLILVTNSLLLAKQFELGILLSHYNFVRLQESFSPNFLRIPDFRNLYFFSQCLAKLPNFTLPIAELLRHGPTLSDNGESDYTEYVSIFRKLIFDLQEAGNFEQACNIVNLLPKANVNEFIINEWMLKAKKSNNSQEMTYLEGDGVVLDNLDLTFWENCWAQVTKLDPSMHSAFKVMERFLQHLQPNQLLIKCFVLLKCCLAIESILRDFIETNQSESAEEGSQNSFFDDLATNNIDLVQDYFQFEYSLWSSAVECEYLIAHKMKQSNSNQKGDQRADLEKGERTPFNDSFEDPILRAWNLIWREILNYIKSSSFSNYIIPKLSLKHTFFYKNINAKRKQVIPIDSSKQEALSKVIGKLLHSLCLHKAREVSTMFGFSHDDFEIIEACDNAAKGKVQNVSDASFAIQFKIQNLESAGTFKLVNSYSLFPSQNLSAEQKRTISLIATFTTFATIGKKSCKLILLYYKIACILRVPYSELMDSHFSSVKVFHLLLSSGQTESGAELSNLYHGRSRMESISDAVDHDNNRNSLDPSAQGQSFLINKYTEAIGCAKELVEIVAEQDEQLNSEAKIATLLAAQTQSNVQQLVDRQFKDSLSVSGAATGQVPTNLITEIELDKNQLSLYSARFLVLIKLLKTPSTLGHTLLDICKKQKITFDSLLERSKDCSVVEAKSEFDLVLSKRKHYLLLVELTIRAHECFTAECDVHGIALVLRRTRLLITQELQSERYFHLILRLLTGLGRYSEMTYCFDLFRECDRFELILSKRVTRTHQLRIALLNYLKTMNKVDELLPLVAIRFFLFRETADYHCSRAQRLLSEISAREVAVPMSSVSLLTTSQSFAKFSSSPGLPSILKPRSLNSLGEISSNSPSWSAVHASQVTTSLASMRDKLSTLMYEFQEADSNYTKASSHTNADYCSRKAQLVALQISYINRVTSAEATGSSSTAISSLTVASQTAVPFIMNMEPSQAREFIYQCSHFFEALIVSRAYLEANIDWTDPFFRNVILQNNMDYLHNFSGTFPLSLSLLKSLVNRYNQLAAAVKHSRSKESTRELSHLEQSSSPSSASFNWLLSQVRTESDLQKARRVLESLLERVLCNYADSGSSLSCLPTSTCNLKDKYKLCVAFDSSRIMQRLMEADSENAAYLLDLRHTKIL